MHIPNASTQSDNMMTTSVKGLLDAPDRSKRTATSGWRYLQCSNTTDELKVLIPPRVATLYTKLLKEEDRALKQNLPDSDRELLYIRYLKDAMVKKCTKLVQKQLKSEPELQHGEKKWSSFTLPAHFTLKRLEQWYEQKKVIRDGPLETTREGQGRRQHADFYVENSDASSFKRDRAHEASSAAHSSNRRTLGQGPSPNDGGLPPTALESVQSPRRNLHNITASLKGTLKLSHANLSPSGKLVPPTELQSPSGRKLNSHQQLYSNSDALGSTHNPYFDPNYTLAARSPIAAHGVVPTSPSHPSDSYPMHSPRYDPMAIPGQTRSDPSDRVSTSAADPSRLKSRFDAAYASQPPLASPGRRPSLPRRTSASSTTRSSPPGAAPPQTLNGVASATHVQMRKSYTIGHSMHGTAPGDSMSPPAADPEPRRRATLDSGDTERSVPRRRAYMYRTSETLIADGTRLQPLQAGAMYPDTHRNARVGFQQRHSSDATANTLSPMVATHGTFSPIGLASTASSNSYTGSPKQRSPPSDRLSIPSSSPQIPQTNSNANSLQHRKASPVPPSSAAPPGRVRVSSIDSSNGPVVNPREITPAIHGRRGSSDRKNPNPSGSPTAGNIMPTVYERSVRQGESVEVGTDMVTQSNSISLEGPQRRLSRSRNKVLPPAQRNDNLEFETPRNIWQTNGPIKPVSTRSSIYTSGESDGGPVIPDASLIMDAVLMRARDKPRPRQLVPFLSSSEENTSYRPTDVDTDFSSESSDSEDGRGRQAMYGRPHRDRDGYNSEAGSVAGSVRSRASSRPPSRPPSRGILKRSNSTCSQRSAKSVRLEITEDRVALEEAREAEEVTNKAREKLKDATRKKAMGVDGADLDVYKANEQVKSAESVLEAKVARYETILKEQKSRRKAIEREEPVFVDIQ